MIHEDIQVNILLEFYVHGKRIATGGSTGTACGTSCYSTRINFHDMEREQIEESCDGLVASVRDRIASAIREMGS